ncbi:MAG: BREX-1 system phosphatase PglZ type A [Terrisporobacter sp.]|uniref:BREX-1 system phosphatase PglZ type A n=1 Tax=Terrisporobacter sp. TaxID=1965305 RepID=UPI002FC619BD
MNIDKIQEKLRLMFQPSTKIGENRKIIFWTDPKEQYREAFDNNEINIENVKIHELRNDNNFYTKYLLNKEDVDSNYLIYTNLDNLMDESSWIIDIVLYSQIFYADKLSMDLDDLGIDFNLRDVASKYEIFFNNRKRIEKLQSLNIKDYTEEVLELGMIASLCACKTTDVEEIFRSILMKSIDEDGYICDDEDNKYYKEINNILGSDALLKYARKYYGFNKEEFSIKKLLITIIITSLTKDIDTDLLSNYNSYISNEKLNCYLFIDRWINDVKSRESYYAVANTLENELGIFDMFRNIEIDYLKNIDILPCIDKQIILYIVQHIEIGSRKYDDYIKTIKERRTTNFYSKYENTYEALINVIEMHSIAYDNIYGILKEDPKTMFNTYKDEYYKMDMYYRKFYIAHDKEINNDIPKKLSLKVEELYEKFINELNSKWTDSLETNIGDSWGIAGVKNQKYFYRDYINPSVSIGERIFVIISDALRYEVGKELCDKLNEEVVGSSNIDAVLSVVPSITKLGMASLLPYKNIEIKNNGHVFVNGEDANEDDYENKTIVSRSSAGLENRNKIIKSSVTSSIAIDYDKLIQLTREERKEMLKGYKLVYIYHDEIDARGDKASTENQAFEATEKAISEIQRIIKIIRNELSGTNVVVTSDHGFIYQKSKLKESDKIDKEIDGALEIGRRYMLNDKDKYVEGTMKFNMDYILGDDNELYAYIPNSIMRFKIQGSGANFVHGGASLQEVVIPVIQFKNIRKSSKNSVKVEKVKIHPIVLSNKITNTPFKVRMYQTEKLSSNTKVGNYSVYLADESGNIVSDIHNIIADKSSDNPSEREFNIVLNIPRTNQYDRNQNYYLITKDKDEEIIINKTAFKISLGIMSGIDFF